MIGTLSEAAPNGFRHADTQFVLGIIGLASITFAAVLLNLQPGATSLLYLIVVSLDRECFGERCGGARDSSGRSTFDKET